MTQEQIDTNKSTYVDLVKSITRDGFDSTKLLSYLEATDFYIAPASTKYHGSYKGGLCDHSLCVYYNLKALVHTKGMEDIISEDSIKIAALFHDLAKIDSYEIYFQNKKVYCEDGDKHDNNGRFTWVSVSAYKYKDAENRVIYGNHEETSEYIARQYVPLTMEESVAILKHHASMGWDSAKDDISSAYTRYPLACLLHLADMLTTYIDQA